MNAASLRDVVLDQMSTISLIAIALPHFTAARAEEMIERLQCCADRIIEATSADEQSNSIWFDRFNR